MKQWALLLSFHFLLSSFVYADLQIVHFNVGMGDATLIRDIDSNKTLLIDAGNRGFGRRVVAPELRKLGVDELNYFVASHYDADHIGGFDELIDEGVEFIEAVYDRGNLTHRKLKTANNNDTQYGEYVEKSGAKRKTLKASCEASTQFDLGETEIFVVASGGFYAETKSGGCEVKQKNINKSKDNDLSIALVINHGHFRYFIGGDLTGGGKNTTDMEKLISRTVDDVDVLRLSHHGSSSSTNDIFAQRASPEVVVISVGNGGSNRSIYHLPNQSVLDIVSGLPSEPVVFLTNRGEGGNLPDARIVNGHITILVTGDGYMVNNEFYRSDEFLIEE